MVTNLKRIMSYSRLGSAHFRYIPPELADLPSERVTHSSDHSNLERFKDREVTVIGAGSSAVDLAALLFERGAKVQFDFAATFHRNSWQDEASALPCGIEF